MIRRCKNKYVQKYYSCFKITFELLLYWNITDNNSGLFFYFLSFYLWERFNEFTLRDALFGENLLIKKNASHQHPLPSYFLEDSGKARSCSTNTFVINSLIKSVSQPLVKISVQRRHAQTVQNGASSHKTNYINIFSDILNLEGHQNRWIGSKVTAILRNGGFCLLVELHREGSVPAACAAGLFF